MMHYFQRRLNFIIFKIRRSQECPWFSQQDYFNVGMVIIIEFATFLLMTQLYLSKFNKLAIFNFEEVFGRKLTL